MMVLTSPSASDSGVTDLTPQEFAPTAAAWCLLDVRSHFEYTLFHAPTAINLSLPRILMARLPQCRNWVLPRWFRDLPRDQPIAIVCLTAHRSPLAAQALVAMGFSQVANITGGMMAWQQARLPTLRGHERQ